MYEIIDGKVVKREVTESLVEVSSESIKAEINSIDETIKSLDQRRQELKSDYETVLKLESQI